MAGRWRGSRVAYGRSRAGEKTPASRRQGNDAQIAETRREYFSLYNRLNTVPRFELVCRERFDEPTSNPALDRLKKSTAAEEAEYLKHVARVVEQNPQLLAIGARLKFRSPFDTARQSGCEGKRTQGNHRSGVHVAPRCTGRCEPDETAHPLMGAR